MRLLRCIHDDVIKWRHYPRYWPFVWEFPTQRPVTPSFDVFFDLRLNKRLSKQSSGWWFETPSRPLWRHRNGNDATCVTKQRQLVYYKACSRWNLKAVISITWKYHGKTEPILTICYVLYTSICYYIYLILITLLESRDLIWWQRFILAYIFNFTFSVLRQTYLAWHSQWVSQHKYRIANNSFYITTGIKVLLYKMPVFMPEMGFCSLRYHSSSHNSPW